MDRKGTDGVFRPHSFGKLRTGSNLPSSGERDFMSEYLAEAGVPAIAQPVAEKIEGEHSEEYCHAGEERDPPGVVQIVASVSYHRTPCGGGKRDARTEVSQNRFGKDDGANLQSGRYDKRVRDAWQDMPI